MGGHVNLYTDTIVSSVSLIKSGKTQPIGMTTAKRKSILPNAPTIAEQCLPGFDLVPWTGWSLLRAHPRKSWSACAPRWGRTCRTRSSFANWRRWAPRCRPRASVRRNSLR
ncbi:hypothetical protein [Ramlibacter sp.]|uniref:hypothetical protein n=1 Tax=Ramlibacter sp. TaxID=1917967 RepID=UPI0039C9A8B3